MNTFRYFFSLAICIVSMEAKSYYEAMSPNGSPSIQAFKEGQPPQPYNNPQTMKLFDGHSHNSQYPLDKDYYVSFLETEVDSNMVIAGTAFIITMLLLLVNMYYPLSHIHLPLIDGKPTRDSRNILIPDSMEEISSKINNTSKAVVLQ